MTTTYAEDSMPCVQYASWRHPGQVVVPPTGHAHARECGGSLTSGRLANSDRTGSCPALLEPEPRVPHMTEGPERQASRG